MHCNVKKYKQSTIIYFFVHYRNNLASTVHQKAYSLEVYAIANSNAAKFCHTHYGEWRVCATAYTTSMVHQLIIIQWSHTPYPIYT